MKHEKAGRVWRALDARNWAIAALFFAIVAASSLLSQAGSAPLPLNARLSAYPAAELLPGATQSYSITITNPTAKRAANLRMRASIDASLQVLSVTDGKFDAASGSALWNVAELAAGHTITVSFMGRLSSAARVGENFNVRLFVAANGIAEQGIDSLSTRVGVLPEGPRPHLTTFQTIDPPNPRPGEAVMFHVIVHNDGQLPARGVVASEQLPPALELLPDMIYPHLSNFAASTQPATRFDAAAGTLQMKVDQLMPNEWTALMFSARVRPDTAAGSEIIAEANIEAAEADTTHFHTTAPVKLQIAAEAAANDISIDVKADKSAANVGDKLTYTITVTNGRSAAINKLKITNKIPAELRLINGSSTTSCGLKVVEAGTQGQVLWKKGTLPGSGSCVVSFQATVASGPANGMITNTATAKAAGAGMASGSAQTAVQAPSVANVDIMDNFFSTTMLKVPAGTTVTWNDRGNIPHTVTGAQCNAISFASDSQFPNGLRNGDKFSFTVPANAASGTVIYYFCRFHGAPGSCTALGSGMAGAIIVQ